MTQADPVRVAVVDEQEIFRRGLVACLEDDPLVAVVNERPDGPIPESADVAVVSARALSQGSYNLPLVVCADAVPRRVPRSCRRHVAAVLPRGTLTPEQLVATICAAAAGLQVQTETAISDNDLVDGALIARPVKRRRFCRRHVGT